MSLKSFELSEKTLRRIGILLAALGVGLLLVWLVTTLLTVRSLYVNVQEAQRLMASGDPLEADLNAVGALLHDSRQDIVVLKRRAGWLVQAAPAFSWLPRVGPLAAEAPALFALGDALSELAVLFWDDAAPSLAQVQAGASPQAVLPDLAPALSRNLADKVAAADRAQRAYAGIDPQALPAQYRSLFLRLGQVIPLLDAVAAVEALPALLGLDEPALYLVLALNEDELRPGGGFISGVGEVALAAGDIISMTFRDSYAVDDLAQPYPDAPEPLRRFMGLDLMPFRDANWNPDFPTAVREALPLYRPGYPVDVDGVIALDQTAVQQLVAAVGPIRVEGVAQPVTGANLLDFVRAAYNPDDGATDGGWWRERKSFMGDIAAAVMARVKSGGIDWLALGEAGLAMLEQRHIQIALLEPTAAARLRELGWDGSVVDTGAAGFGGDLLMVVEANVGFNKVSTGLDRALRYEVDLGAAQPEAVVTLDYAHPAQQARTCKPGARYAEGEIYAEMMDRCAWTYLRLYTPPGTLLLDASEHPIPADLMTSGMPWPGEAQATTTEDHTILAQAFLLPSASQARLHFTYRLPPAVVHCSERGVCTYSLLIQKQAGLRRADLHVALRLPKNAVPLGAHPRSLAYEDGVFFYDADFVRDVELSVTYRLAED